MTKAGVVRGIVASMFAIGTAAAGLAVTSSAAGAGAGLPPNCTVTPTDDGAGAAVAPQPIPARCATLEVTKVVTGSPAPQTTFTVGVDCAKAENGVMAPGANASDALPPGQEPPFTTTLTFPAQGGTQDVLIAAASDCTVTETPPPGCTLTSIDPVTTHVNEPVKFPVTVTNDCPAPAQPQAPAQPAVAVVVAPLFTG